MILDDPRGRTAALPLGIRTTLDELLQRAAQQRPDAIALIDPPDRDSFTGGEPRRLTFAQADRVVSAIAHRLHQMGLRTDAVVGIQIANTVDGVLTILGVLRAGLIAMPIPLLWRRAEAVAALSRVGTHALIVSGRIGAVDHYDLAMQVAAEIFPIRYVGGFGPGAPDGVVAFDDLYSIEAPLPLPAHDAARVGDPAAHLAAITWDVSPGGPVPVARSHAELIAGGFAVLLEGRLPPEAVMLSPMTLSSFAGLATALAPWLLLGGTLVLHQPFDPEIFRAQCETAAVDTVIVPGQLAVGLAQAGLLVPRDRARTVIGVWHAPQLLAHAPPWPDAAAPLLDVQVFGEVGLLAASRRNGRTPDAIPFGAVTAPRDGKGAAVAVEIAPTPNGTLAMRGAMVPHACFPPGAERSGLPYLRISPSGFVDTGYACTPDSAALLVTGAPDDVVGIGGYRLPLSALHVLADAAGATLTALPDPLSGHRLAATAADRDAVQAALVRLGANPLLVEAFQDRPEAA